MCAHFVQVFRAKVAVATAITIINDKNFSLCKIFYLIFSHCQALDAILMLISFAISSLHMFSLTLHLVFVAFLLRPVMCEPKYFSHFTHTHNLHCVLRFFFLLGRLLFVSFNVVLFLSSSLSENRNFYCPVKWPVGHSHSQLKKRRTKNKNKIDGKNSRSLRQNILRQNEMRKPLIRLLRGRDIARPTHSSIYHFNQLGVRRCVVRFPPFHFP